MNIFEKYTKTNSMHIVIGSRQIGKSYFLANLHYQSMVEEMRKEKIISVRNEKIDQLFYNLL